MIPLYAALRKPNTKQMVKTITKNRSFMAPPQNAEWPALESNQDNGGRSSMSYPLDERANMGYYRIKFSIYPAESPMKYCHRCQETKSLDLFYSRRGKSQPSSYCKLCMNAQAIDRQRALKLRCIAYKGGKCQRCGFNEHPAALEFHHNDRSKKEFAIAEITKTNFDKNPEIKLELDKCSLLCANCHRIVHATI